MAARAISPLNCRGRVNPVRGLPTSLLFFRQAALPSAPGQLRIELGLQVVVESTRSHRQGALTMRLEVEIVTHNQRHTDAATGNPIPGCALGERRGLAANVDRRDDSRRTQGDVGCATMEDAALLRLGAGTFGEHDQSFTFAQSLD